MPTKKPKPLYNQVDKKILKSSLAKDKTPRTTLSFYRYSLLRNPEELRDKLYAEWNVLGVLGRIYLATEGINAQMSVPTARLGAFRLSLASFVSPPPDLKKAVQDNGKSFYKLKVKVRKHLVASGIDDLGLLGGQANHISAREFNHLAGQENTLVVDARNHYEHEVGRFENAVRFDADTFRELIPKAMNELQGQEGKTILLYCTGGIRCETVSALLIRKGFESVFQLDGGIIQYSHSVRKERLPSRFIGKNFVFDERLGEVVTEDIISHCHQCNAPCNRHVNCKNDDCHLLFLQCEDCAKQMQGCCSEACVSVVELPIEQQRRRRRGKKTSDALGVYKSRLRPRLSARSNGKTT